MVRCSVCNVNTVDRLCTRPTGLCYDCCSTQPGQLSCPHHFNHLPPGQQASVRAAQQAADAAAPVLPLPAASSAAVSVPPVADAPSVINADALFVSAPPSSLPSAAPAPQSVPVAVAPPSPAVDLQQYQQQSERRIQALEAQIATQTAQLAQQTATFLPLMGLLPTLERLLAAAAPSPLPLPVPQSAQPVPVSVAPLSATVAASPRASANAAPHRDAVLNAPSVAQAAVDQLISHLLQQPGSHTDEEKEVRATQQTQITSAPPRSSAPSFSRQIPPLQYASAHVRSVIFPPCLAPPPLGGGAVTEETFSATGIKFTNKSYFDPKKFKTAGDLNAAFEDWTKLAIGTGWSADLVVGIGKYRSFLVDTMAAANGLAAALSYHALFARAVDEGRHDMFATGGHYLPDVYIAVLPNSSSTAKRGSSGGKRGSPKPTSGKEPGKTYPAGSCRHHPDSTTHTTAVCRKTTPAAAATAAASNT
jgi:hypothetical protein